MVGRKGKRRMDNKDQEKTRNDKGELSASDDNNQDNNNINK